MNAEIQFIRALLLWCGIIPLAILNGILRDLVLARRMRPKTARLASGISLSFIILGWSILTIPWLQPARSERLIALGGLWLLLTVAFEFLFGRYVSKMTWADLMKPYQFKDGEIWPVVLLMVLFAPLMAAALRSVL